MLTFACLGNFSQFSCMGHITHDFSYDFRTYCLALGDSMFALSGILFCSTRTFNFCQLLHSFLSLQVSRGCFLCPSLPVSQQCCPWKIGPSGPLYREAPSHLFSSSRFLIHQVSGMFCVSPHWLSEDVFSGCSVMNMPSLLC